MEWPTASDFRDLRTDDWLTDACENAVTDDDRISGRAGVQGLFTPVSVDFDRGGEQWRHPVPLLAVGAGLVLCRKQGFGRGVQALMLRAFEIVAVGTDVAYDGHRYSVAIDHEVRGRILFKFTNAAPAHALKEMPAQLTVDGAMPVPNLTGDQGAKVLSATAASLYCDNRDCDFVDATPERACPVCGGPTSP